MSTGTNHSAGGPPTACSIMGGHQTPICSTDTRLEFADHNRDRLYGLTANVWRQRSLSAFRRHFTVTESDQSNILLCRTAAHKQKICRPSSVQLSNDICISCSLIIINIMTAVLVHSNDVEHLRLQLASEMSTYHAAVHITISTHSPLLHSAQF